MRTGTKLARIVRQSQQNSSRGLCPYRKDNMKGECLPRLTALGISHADAVALRRIAMTLNRWHEMECGTDNGCVERDEQTNKTYWLNSSIGKRWLIPDRETGAQKRLSAIMARYPELTAYIQGDPRGASLYILRPGDVPKGGDVNSYYSNGIAVYK